MVIYIYVRIAQARVDKPSCWSQMLYPNFRFVGESNGDNTIALSSDGNTAFIGNNPDLPNNRATYIFVRNGEAWAHRQKLEIPVSIGFGWTVAISNDCKTAVVGDTLP